MKDVNNRVEQDREIINPLADDPDVLFKEESTLDKEQETIILNQLLGSAEEIRNAKKVRIMMHNQEGALGNQPVFVSVNGMGYSIPRDVPVVIPVPILKALEDAVETKYYREEIGGVFVGPMLERQVRRFPFSIIS
jgi:hypothetical protein